MTGFEVQDNPASFHPEALTRARTYTYLAGYNLFLLIFPVELLCDYSGGTVPLLLSFADRRNMFGLLVLLLLFVTVHSAWRPKDKSTRQMLFCGGLMVVCWLPASNLFFRVGFVVAERVLYMPSVG